MRFHVISIFPEMFAAVAESGITSRAFRENLASLSLVNPRDFTEDTYRRVDDRPYGGGPGMVMMPGPLTKALGSVFDSEPEKPHVILMSPQGAPLTHAKVKELSLKKSLVIVCGRYEAVDARFTEKYVDEEISIGDYVVSGGELPAMVLIDSLVRLIPGALHDSASAEEDSFVSGLLDCEHFTRPPEFEGMAVPDVLMGGDHGKIAAYRRERSLELTATRRPDLIAKALADGALTDADKKFLEKKNLL